MRTVCIFLAAVSVSMGRINFSDNVVSYDVILEKAVISLNKLLDYMLEPRSVVGDMIFGVVVSAAQLSILKNHLTSKDIHNGVVNATVAAILEEKCKEIYNRYMPMRVDENSTDYNIIMDYAVKQDLWELDYPIEEGRLPKSKKQLCLKEVQDLIMMGTPQEQQSDQCIAELLQPEKCAMSSECNYLETNNEEVHGYPLTHRLLYFQIAKRLGCGKLKTFESLQKQILNLCSNILEETHYITQIGIPPLFRDLFLEQISLCGIEGFAEFLNPHFIEWALDQQMPNGCFTQEKESILKWRQNRVKREDGELDSGCTMHVTGMAAVFLTINIRAIVEYWSI